jgi:hypothetical protein
VHARARCRRPPAGSRSESEQNHGYENEWEEALNDQENECTQDHPPRERRAGGREEDQRQEKGPGAQEGSGAQACRAKDRGPQGAGEARSGEEASSQTCRAKEKSRSEAGSGGAETDGPGAKAGRASSASTGAATHGAACHGNAHGSEACRPHWRWSNAAASRRRHGHARAILGRRHAKLKPEPERAALSAVLGARRRRHVVAREGGHALALPLRSFGIADEATKVQPLHAVEAILGELRVVEQIVLGRHSRRSKARATRSFHSSGSASPRPSHIRATSSARWRGVSP